MIDTTINTNIKTSSKSSFFHVDRSSQNLLILLLLQLISLPQLSHGFDVTLQKKCHRQSSRRALSRLNNTDSLARRTASRNPFLSTTQKTPKTTVAMAISPIEGDTSSRHRLSTAIETIRTAATPNQPTRDALLAAIVETQQRYGMVGDGGDGFPPRKGFLEALAGGGTPGRRWKLVYVCGKESVVAARKRWRRVGGSATDPSDSTTERRSAWDPNRFGLLRWFPPVLRYGQYVDGFVTAVQRFDMETFENENGILAVGGSEFVGFTVVGPFKWPKCDEGRQVCAFRPTEVRVRVGSEWSWSTLLSGGDETVPFSDAKVTELPFFRFILVDDRVAVAQGRSGSVALWTRM